MQGPLRRAEGKDERSDVNPSLGFQVPPVAAIDTFLHHRSGCKKASTYGKMNLPSVAAVKAKIGSARFGYIANGATQTLLVNMSAHQLFSEIL